MMALNVYRKAKRIVTLILLFLLLINNTSSLSTSPSSNEKTLVRVKERLIDPAAIRESALSSTGLHASDKQHVTYRCEPVTLPLCKGMYYSNTRMPNLFHHVTQAEAAQEVDHFYPLVQINCSEDLRFLLCSIYAPICVDSYPSFLPPCRSLCERVKKGCAPIMRHYNFPWPDRMQCHRFPEYNNRDNVLCMERNLSDPSSSNWIGGRQGARKSVAVGSSDVFDRKAAQTLLEASKKNTTVVKALQEKPELNLSCECGCNQPLVYNELTGSKIVMGNDLSLPNCSLPCHSMHFNSPSYRRFTSVWLTLWSTLCLVSTSATLLTFLAKPSRFHYPELSIVYLCCCYLFIAIGYLVRIGLGHNQVSCVEDNAAQPALIQLNHLTASSRHSSKTGCAVVFLLTYFFGVAASVWWVVLSLTWLLAAGLKWGREAIAKYSRLFHLVAWSIPTALTTLALIVGVIEGDPVSGLCTIGISNRLPLLLFNILPTLVFLSIGGLHLLIGYIALIRIRGTIKLQLTNRLGKTSRLESFMLRIGVFGLLYALPNLIVLVCLGFEWYHSEEWHLGEACKCQFNSPNPTVPNYNLEWSPPKPIYSLYMLRHFMHLAIGITSGFWIFSFKTLETWKRILNKVCRCCGKRTNSSVTMNLLPNNNNTFMPFNPNNHHQHQYRHWNFSSASTPHSPPKTYSLDDTCSTNLSSTQPRSTYLPSQQPFELPLTGEQPMLLNGNHAVTSGDVMRSYAPQPVSTSSMNHNQPTHLNAQFGVSNNANTRMVNMNSNPFWTSELHRNSNSPVGNHYTTLQNVGGSVSTSNAFPDVNSSIVFGQPNQGQR